MSPYPSLCFSFTFAVRFQRRIKNFKAWLFFLEGPHSHKGSTESPIGPIKCSLKTNDLNVFLSLKMVAVLSHRAQLLSEDQL